MKNKTIPSDLGGCPGRLGPESAPSALSSPPLAELVINLAWRAASQHDLDRLLVAVYPLQCIEDTTWHGACDKVTGTIYIRTHTLHKNKPRQLKIATIIDTMAHELAHLMEWRHGRPHRNLTLALRSWLEANWGHDPQAQHPIVVDAIGSKV